MKVTSSSGVSNTFYLQNEKALKFYVNNSPYFEISASLF